MTKLKSYQFTVSDRAAPDLSIGNGIEITSREALIFDAVRTPRGRGEQSGSLHTTKPVNLVAGLIAETLGRNPGLDPSRIDDTVLGCATPIGDQGGNIARTAALMAGLPNGVGGMQLNRFAASGLEAISVAVQRVALGAAEAVLAGGVESNSRVPSGRDGGPRMDDPETALATGFVPDSVGADLIATIDGIDRLQLDDYAALSRRRAREATESGRFDPSLVPVLDLNGLVILDHDEYVSQRGDTFADRHPALARVGEQSDFDAVALQRYHWIESIDHVHTPATSAPPADGAALLVVGSEQAGAEMGLTPRLRVLATALSGSEPMIGLSGAAEASRKALKIAGLEIADLDLVEVTEVFASVVLRFSRELGIDLEQINVNGGSIALGDPLGATGGMMMATLADELARRQERFGLVAMSAAAGTGIATVVERL